MALIQGQFVQVTGFGEGQHCMVAPTCIIPQKLSALREARPRQGLQHLRLRRCCVQGVGQCGHKIQMYDCFLFFLSIDLVWSSCGQSTSSIFWFLKLKICFIFKFTLNWQLRASEHIFKLYDITILFMLMVVNVRYLICSWIYLMSLLINCYNNKCCVLETLTMVPA